MRLDVPANPGLPAPHLSVRATTRLLAALFLAAGAVWLSSRPLLSTEFLPHRYCLADNARLLWTNVTADLLIGLSYAVISVTLAWLVRRTRGELPYSRVFWAFGLFIVSCGVTHFFEVVTLWKPVYWLSALAKVFTAVASVGTAVALLVLADDIVAFVRTARESATRRGNERFRALIQAAPMAVIALDRDGQVTTWNRAAEAMFGWDLAEVIGGPLPLVPPDRRAEYESLISKAFAGETITAVETVRSNRQGQPVPVSISVAPVRDDLQQVCGAIAVLENITERKRIATELQEKTAQIRQAQKMEVLGRLAGGVAHDFNNMLMVLGGCSELLERSLPKESPARIYLDQIQRTTEKATAITKQLLAFSRKQVLEFRPTDLHQRLAESEFMLPRLLGSDVELTFRREANRSWILSDASQIQQVVANLAINARDAMPGGGRLTISTRNVTGLPSDTSDSSSSAGDWVVLEVADTGSGMDEKTRAQIFEPFFTTKPDGKGTGLGLATVYGIVKQSSGHIEVDSAPGKGTRFELYFPGAEPPPIAVPVMNAVNDPAEPNACFTVLVADDEPALRQAVVQILRSNGYKVLEAQSSTEALDMAHRHAGHLDVLLTDVVMPAMRGPELARRVAQAHPEAQVIYMSGYAEGFEDAQLPANSVFLQKPFRFATLLEQLKLVRRKS
jgi:two-component system, cell cycle sensor histidine kinase and response regulator CckA